MADPVPVPAPGEGDSRGAGDRRGFWISRGAGMARIVGVRDAAPGGVRNGAVAGFQPDCASAGEIVSAGPVKRAKHAPSAIKCRSVARVIRCINRDFCVMVPNPDMGRVDGGSRVEAASPFRIPAFRP
jgi:hypothetical protein